MKMSRIQSLGVASKRMEVGSGARGWWREKKRGKAAEEEKRLFATCTSEVARSIDCHEGIRGG